MAERDKGKNEPEDLPFLRKVTTRQPGIVGAQWWNEGLSEMQDPMSRRSALKALAALGGVVAVGGGIIAAVTGVTSDPIEDRDTLETQRAQGWNFGAPDEALSFVGQSSVAYDASSFDTLATGMAPRQDSLKPFYQATLFQALAEVPGTNWEGLQSKSALKGTLRPIFTPAMDTAFRQGLALESLFPQGQEVSRTTAVFVDLPGPETVAFSTGLARRFEPIYTFDNWPHPRGVVPAHLTLAAVVYYRPLLDRLARERSTPAPPVFVLDRNRLLPFTDVKKQFDNRYLVRLPPAQSLKGLGIQHVLYIVPGDVPLQELDDINEDFVSYREAGIDVKAMAASDFQPADPKAEDALTQPYTADALAALPRQPYFFGGSPQSHSIFWGLYPWWRNRPPSVDPSSLPSQLSRGHYYEPQRRATMFTPPPNSASGAPRQRPNGFAKVQVRVARGTQQILGFAHGSYSSWNRAPTSSSYSSYGG
ncbi:hypothetical protein [Hyalangium versicolor]|uniref:hypothetical protein n=1 Tax=Hyalangium versicolor TaxID=2861190 RepID=UPI001CC927DE|nr:hypothetical protein [Hyalangium versicolor]